MCVSLDELEPVDSVLKLLSGYDILEYSWVKATAVSVYLRILFVTLQNTNNMQVNEPTTKNRPIVCIRNILGGC